MVCSQPRVLGKMKGIILAGGNGSRLFPSTISISKQLLPIYDKPLIFYPLSILMLADIKEILIICFQKHLDLYKNLLGDGTKYGVNIKYEIQDIPKGIADAFVVGEKFIKKDKVCLVLGDNIFWGQGFSGILQRSRKVKGAKIFGYRVDNPSEFGVLTFNADGTPKTIEEKPKNPKGNLAIPGLYFYDNSVIERAKNLRPSIRGELEITDLNKTYIKDGLLEVTELGRGFAWLDTGTPESLLEASNFVGMIEKRQGKKIACLEEIALQKSWISKTSLGKTIKNMPNSSYRDYLKKILNFRK